jgi:hypothetical protein
MIEANTLADITGHDEQTGASGFRPFKRTRHIEARPWTAEDAKWWREHASHPASISEADRVAAGMPEPIGMLARNPDNHADQWYIAPAYFAKHYEPAAER